MGRGRERREGETRENSTAEKARRQITPPTAVPVIFPRCAILPAAARGCPRSAGGQAGPLLSVLTLVISVHTQFLTLKSNSLLTP